MDLKTSFWLLSLFLCLVEDGDAGKGRKAGRHGQKFLRNVRLSNHVRRNATQDSGLWPSVFNLATKAVISVNATCGEGGREEFCRMAEGAKGRCGICDNFSPDSGKRHSIHFAIDGSNRWWQSPALFYGPEFEYVTITIDLKQVYQIMYVIIKAANSPRPGTWILERSIDGDVFEPWQYFARNDKECVERFGMTPRKGKPKYFTDSEVICTSFYSKLTPMENGEIHTSLIHGRPGANETSPELLEFTRARYVQLRLMGLRGNVEPLPEWFVEDLSRDKRLFYSIRDINIGGQCVCNGHAQNCRYNVASGHPECDCGHHTCGPHCDRCCPLYNQRPWGPGSSRDARPCQSCNCHGHAKSCHYDEEVEKAGLSMDIQGNYQGGGVCDNCTDHTTGINCELCLPGYYRPSELAPDSEAPCVRCKCDGIGGSTDCVQYGEEAGKCVCQEGYSGPNCDECAPGFRGFPNCERCPCDPKGVVNVGDCEGSCICKDNVEGEYCDRCKPEHFGLRTDYPGGCAECYCSGVTSLCESAILQSRKISIMKDWYISDLKNSIFVKPTKDDQGLLSVGSYELPDVEAYYWLAPGDFTGNKLEAYSSDIVFKVHWVIMRGDTSGEPTVGPNIILVGRNGMTIAHGNEFFADSSNTTFRVKMNEVGWYHVSKDVKDIGQRLRREEYRGDPVNRRQFLSLLSDIRFLMVRATFHTDQIEALLESAEMFLGNIDESETYSAVEKCSCPSGYSGLSCESCSFGYVRIMANTSDHRLQAFCGKCDCNGHSETCSADTGECSCLHNTIGERCERCAPGFYGNPLRGTPFDCKPCACPLENEENNFSPSCQLDYVDEEDEDRGGYVCTQCPKGYTGDHCDVCDDGYFGNPLEIGNKCSPCDCGGGPCDRVTGQCLSCKGNTEGWKCERCKPAHYGDPAASDCMACLCDPVGSLYKECDNETGQCQCKPHYIGRTCDKCEEGFGNATGGCAPCNCDPVGSVSLICDAVTGLCECRPGVEGFHCDACQNLHYGFSKEGCEPCGCDPDGSLFNTCNSSGQCMCKPNYQGSKCKRCKTGYWKHPERGCIECFCNRDGSVSRDCDAETGKCLCKPGVGGDRCNSCLPRYYGNITNGCKECDPCDKEGHICDPYNGKCVCPYLTAGYSCERCALNSWGYIPLIGCKNCSCSTTGSLKQQCDPNSGKCDCKKGYEGEKCDSCSFGYYGYPNCRQCTCDPNGTLEGEFANGVARCDEDGGCRCKEFVEGKKCNECKHGTFGLDKNNPQGCIKCFCFGRSNTCTALDYTWDQLHTDRVPYTKDNCLFSSPCINLPPKFTGDLTLSYGGFLRIIGPSTTPEYLVRLTGNNVTIESSFSDDVRLDELNWRIFRTSDKLLPDCNRELNRGCMMVILQNVSNVAVKTSTQEEISEVLLDKAVMISSAQRARTIEKCECPEEYTSLSCQDPSSGHYRYRLQPEDSPHTWVDRIVGVAKKCNCNGLSDTCDIDTGHCLNCRNDTNGPHCEYCAEGFYKTQDNSCMPCQCPSEKQNFAKNCTANHKMNQFVCMCKEGYTGKKCNKCEDGYFGKPQDIEGSCERCDCNPYGSITTTCDKISGRCQCHDGFTGMRCDQCKSPRKYIDNGVCTACDECTQILFNSIDDISNRLNETLESFGDGLQGPWKYLDALEDRSDLLKERFTRTEDQMEKFSQNLEDIRKYEDKANNLHSALKTKTRQLENQIENINRIGSITIDIGKNITYLQNKKDSFVNEMNNFGTSHLNVKKSLEEGMKLLKDIDANAKIINTDEKNDIIFRYCKGIIKQVEDIYQIQDLNIDKIFDEVEHLKMRFNDMNNLSELVVKQAKQVKLRNKDNTIKYHDVNKTISILKNRYKKTMEDIAYSKDKLVKADVTLKMVKKLSQDFLTTDLDKYFEILKKGDENYEDNAEDIEKKLKDIKKHVENLNETLMDLKRQVNFTQEEWKKINAGESYEKIAKGVSEAENDSIEAEALFNRVNEIINPSDTDTLLIQSTLSFGFSDRLKQRIINHVNQNDLRKKLDNVRYELDNLERDIYKSGISINNFSSLMHNLKERISTSRPNMDDMKEVIETASDISRNMTRIISDVNTMRYINEHNLTRPFNKYLNLTSKEKTRELNEQIYSKINEIEKLNINTNLHGIIDRKNDLLAQSYEQLNNLKNKILALKSNITFTTQRVNNLYLPISLANCSRWYQVKNIGVFNSMRMKFNCSTCDLLNLSSNGHKISMRVIDDLFMLEWNKFPVEVEIDKDRITTVEIKRKQNNLYLLIQNQVIEIPDTQLLHISTNDLINIGTNVNHSSAGCLYEFFLNEINVGLWNFVKSVGNCTACETEARGSEQEKLNTLYVDGGYSLYNVSTLNPQQFSVILNFRTFDENSLLFLAQEISNPCAFMSLVLNNGKLEFYMRHNDNSTIVSIPIEKKFNDGKENNINIALQYKSNKQYYDVTVNDMSVNEIRNLIRMHVFRIRQSRYFVGGVSPTFNRSCISVNTTSFVGFLNHRSERNLRTIVSYNTFPRNVKELNFYRAWFTGDGYLILNTTAKYRRRAFNIYFELYTASNTSYLMTIDKVGKLAIRNRKLIFELQNGERIESEMTLNGVLDTVNVTVGEEASILGVNGEESKGQGIKLLRGDPVMLYIGEDTTKEYGGFLGGISNIYIDNKEVNFNFSTVVDFKHVEIGRWRTPDLPEEIPTSLTITENPDSMQNTQGCYPASPHQIDPSAIKFGDKAPSYVYKKNSFWRKNFTMELQFRTLYPEGTLMIATSSKPRPQYNILEIRKGKLQYSIKGKRKPTNIIFDGKVDDAEWHTVIIEQIIVKKKRRLLIALDGDWQKPSKIPKSNVRNEFYLGNVPENFTTRDISIQQFIGCIRDFKINNIPQLNTKDLSDYMNLGSCFPKVERGAYFGGDAYSIYKRDFHVNQQLELSFEFKTSEQNGILLSLSNSGNSPALSIELQNGGMVMSVDLGISPIFSVMNDLNSDFALCNNKWHNVTAIYSQYELTVKIDGIARSWARYDTNSLSDDIEAPLYIGGLPEAAPSGTLKVRENFKGCLRKFKIGEQVKDWTEMEELNGVSLDSCPLVD
ncbi:laminin subunit alpha-1 [Coccinella septempunctata]|uniref:laminin subunit alpha-1 n=1 Tax=Coccinella septempunctata TaxID=41139 RepID=UPI001D080158|nr:laminin subunit alpha-1 [Coccinella septempunctata]